MILFISAYPNAENEKEGMMQRIAAIDKKRSEEERTYLKISFRSNWKVSSEKLSDKLVVMKVNFFLHFFIIMILAFKAKYIYVHSVYNAIYVLPLYIFEGRKIITDMHGVVPEELIYAYPQKKIAPMVFSFVEKIVIYYSMTIITVTNAMADHFYQKYRCKKDKFLTVPIFRNLPCENLEEREIIDIIRIIYSGGTQKYQNIDLMLDTINKIKHKLEFTLLTPDVRFIESKIYNYNIKDKINVLSVSQSEVFSYYLKSEFGFILRENNIVNSVACPTKLIEYMCYGVIPIVVQEKIGDFAEFKYSFITLDDFIKGKIPSNNEVELMRKNNIKVIQKLSTLTDDSLEKVFKGCR